MSFKQLHHFTVTVDREVEEVSTTQTPDGKEITTKSKVVKPVQVTIVLKDPSRSEKQEVTLFQTTSYNDAVRLGLMPRLMMAQTLAAKDPSNSISTEEDRILANTQVKLQELTNDYVRLSSKGSDLSEEDKQLKSKLEADWLTLQKKAIDINSAYQSVFAHTAEQYAQNKVLVWLTLFLTYLKVGPDKYEPLFPGADFKAREDTLSRMEDSGDLIYLAAVQALSTKWMLYFYGRANKHEDFLRIQEEWEKEMKDTEKGKDKESVVPSPDSPPVDPALGVDPAATAPPVS